MSTKDIRQAVASPDRVLVADGGDEASTVGFRTNANFKGDLGLGTSLNITANNGAGSAGAPAFSFTGDLGTGMWRPGDNTLAFSTDGTQKVTITSAGNVGIGTTSTTDKLNVNGRIRLIGVDAKILPSSTISVTTSATTIITDGGFQGQLNIINGADGNDRFCDIVMSSTGAAPVVIQSFNSLGSPAARTYTRPAGGALQLAMASGTYSVRTLSLGA